MQLKALWEAKLFLPLHTGNNVMFPRPTFVGSDVMFPYPVCRQRRHVPSPRLRGEG